MTGMYYLMSGLWQVEEAQNQFSRLDYIYVLLEVGIIRIIQFLNIFPFYLLSQVSNVKQCGNDKRGGERMDKLIKVNYDT